MIPASLTLVAFIVIAPSVAFALGFLQTAPGIGAAALMLGVALFLMRRTDWRTRPDVPLLAFAMIVASALTLLSGIGHQFYQTDDWVVRDAILFDLVRSRWPVAYALDGAAGLLRAPLGMYLIPAALGRLGGLGVAQAALFAQNALLLALCLYLIARAQATRRARFISVGLFVAFSGLDVIGTFLEGTPDLVQLPHIESWNILFQFSAPVTLVFWTPHHALAGWANVAGYLSWRNGRISALALGPLWAASVFWSPLAAAGVLPFLAFAFVCDVIDGKLRLADDVLASAATALAALPLAAFLFRDSSAIEKGLMDVANRNFAFGYAHLLALEVLPFLVIAWPRDPMNRRALIEWLLIPTTLLAIPFYKVGFANDFAMRASIPALSLLYVNTVPALARLGQESFANRLIVLLIVACGAVTPAVEIYRNIRQQPSPASACNVLESLKDGPYADTPLDYYIASRDSFASLPWLFRAPEGAPLARRIEACWPDRGFVFKPVALTLSRQ